MGEGQNKGVVFVSHAAEDKNIAERVINALACGLSLRLDCFFYTSKLSIGVPSGREFFSYIRESICEAKLVISLVSPAFLKSQFCLAESGAAWALGKDWSILMFPGVAPSELGSFLKGLQAARITDKDALSELAGRLSAATGAEARKDALEWAQWESERDEFILFMESLPRTEFQISPLPDSLAEKAKEVEALQKGLQSAQVAIGGRATLTAEGSVILASGFRYVEVKVLNNSNEPIQGASVAIVQQNKTVLQQTTGSDGIATIRVKLGAPVTILCARQGFASHIKTDFDSEQDLIVNLTADNRIGSAIFPFGTGELPFLAGRLNPIRDTLDRTYPPSRLGSLIC